MNKRQFDEIENRIREAAESASPSFSEENWEAMNLLLDKEFPEKRRRRFFFFWFWPLLGVALLAGIIFSSGLHNIPGDQQIITTKKEIVISEDGSGTSYSEKRSNKSQLSHNVTVIDNDPGSKTGKHHFIYKPVINQEEDSTTTAETMVAESNGAIKVKADVINVLTGDSVQQNTAAIPSTDTASKLEEDQSIKKEKKRIKTSGLYFIAAGSFVNNSIAALPSGQVSEEYGIGIGYRINKKLSVQTGIYAGKKKYNANKDEYYFQPGSYYKTVDVNNINANCYVIDIPVSVRYDIAQKRKYSLYAVAGISSYIMKRETYVYSYTKNGTAHTSERTYSGNSHLLSVVGISAGYERKFNQQISILVEPAIKLPLSGVGEGKVKLHSTGLLVGIKYSLPNKMK